MKRPCLVDSLIVLALLALHLLVLHAFSEKPATWLPGWGALMVGVVGIAPLMVRRRTPHAVFALALAAALVLMMGGFPTGAVGLALQVSLYTVAASSSLFATSVAAACTLLAAVVGYVVLGSFHSADVVADLVILAGAIGLGRVTRRSAQRARQLEHVVSQLEEARERLAMEAAVIERNRIARELHDIVAHSLGVIAVHAGVARAMPDDLAQGREALEIIEGATKDALAEMRYLLGALRTPEAPETDLLPQPGLDQLDELVRAMRNIGLSLTMITEGEPYPLTAGQEVTVYRIIQEALTNVLKHAGRATVGVFLRYLGDRLRIEVLNDGAGGTVNERGYGLVGMRERVLVYGGSLEARQLPGGRFQITATLPRELATV